MKKSYIKKRIAWPRIRPAATFAIILLFSACDGSFMSQVTQDVATKYPDLHVLLKATNAEVPSSGYSYNYHQIALNDVSTVDFLITNKGEAALTLQVPTVQVTPVGAFSTSQPADTVLAPGVATQFSVTFSPPAQQGYSASITVLWDDPHHPAFTFSVQGSGSIPPDGLFYIANNASYTNSTTVALTMIFTTPPAWMRFGNTSDLSGAMWEPYAASRANWQLSAGADGQRTVYAQFKDSAGIPSVLKQDSIVLDTVAPSGSITSINGGALYCSSRSVSLLLNATDSGSGVKSMRFMDSASAIPPTFPDPSVLPWQNYATSYSYSLTSASDGTKYVFAQYLDNAGNATTSAISNSITLDTAAPVVNSFSVSSTLTNTRSITLSANVTDSPSGMKDMRFTDSTSSTPPADWSAIPWQTYNTSYSYALASSGDGLKYIHAQFRDTAGNIATALSSTTLDTTPPTGSFSINSGASFSNIQSVRIYNSISGATKMSFTGDISPTVAERAYAASYDVTLTAGEAVKNITGTFKDVAGNQLVQTVSIKLNTFAVSYTSASGNGEMGYSVGINQSGTVAVSGSPYRTWYQPITGGFLVRTEVGAFQIFRKSSGIWAVDGGLNHTGLNYAHMGYSVSVDASGTYITVGAPQDGASTNSPYGKVYRYRYSSGWTLYQTMAEDGSHNGNGQTVLDTGTYFYYRDATLTNNVRRNDGLATTYNAQGFYKDMDASGATGSDYMAVGAPFDVSSQGRVYMCNPALGSPVAKAASDAAANALFGRTVAISRDHNTLVVSDNLGDVYIFQGGVQVQKIPPQGGSQYFGLGLAVSDDGTTIVIGQPAYNSWLGAVYLYVRPPSQPSTWSLVQVYTPPAAVAGDNFGHSVAVSGDGSTIVAGAPTASTTGAAVVYILE